MKKYLPYLIAGVAGGYIYKKMNETPPNTGVSDRPEQDDGSAWWKFWG